MAHLVGCASNSAPSLPYHNNCPNVYICPKKYCTEANLRQFAQKRTQKPLGIAAYYKYCIG